MTKFRAESRWGQKLPLGALGVVAAVLVGATVVSRSLDRNRGDERQPQGAFPVQANSGPAQKVRFQSRPITAANAANMVQVARVGVSNGSLQRTVLSPNRRYLALLSGNHTVSVLDTQTGRTTLWFDAGAMYAYALADDGHTMVIYDDKGLWLVRPHSFRALMCPNIGGSESGRPSVSVAITAHGTQAAAWVRNGYSCVFNTATLKRTQRTRVGSDDRSQVKGYFVQGTTLSSSALPPVPHLDLNDGGEPEISGTRVSVPPPPVAFVAAGVSLDGSTVVGAGSNAVYAHTNKSGWRTLPLRSVHRSAPSAVVLSSNGAYAALVFDDVVGGDQGVTLIDVKNGREVWSSTEYTRVEAMGSQQLTLSNDSSLIGITLSSGVEAWNLALMRTPLRVVDNAHVTTYAGSVALATGLVTSDPSKRSAVARDLVALAGNTIVSWHSIDPQLVNVSNSSTTATTGGLRTMRMDGPLSALAVRADEQELLVARADGVVQRWNLLSGQLVAAVARTSDDAGHIAAVSAVAYSSGGGFVLATTQGSIEVFNAKATLETSHQLAQSTFRVAMSPDGSKVAVQFRERTGDGTLTPVLSVFSVADFATQLRLVVGGDVLGFSADGTTVVFNDGASLERNTLNGIRLPAVALIDFPRALSSAADGYRVYETSGLVQPVSVSGVAGTPAVGAVDSWSGEAPHRFITVGNAIVVEGTADNRPTIIRSTNFVNMPVVSAAQNLIVTAMKDRVIGFDLTTGKQRFTTALITGKQRSTPARIERIVLSPDGKALGVVSDGGGWVLNLQGRVVRTLAVGGSDSFGGRAVAFSPDATLLAFSMGNAMKVFDVATGAELVNVAVSDSASTDVAFAPDQSFVAVLSSNGFLRVFARAKLETP